MLDRQDKKISRSLMTICNVLCFGESCSILKSHQGNCKAYRVINLEMAKILEEKGFNYVLPGQRLCRQCATEYEKLTKPPENENMTEIINQDSSQDELASDDDFLLYESPKKET